VARHRRARTHARGPRQPGADGALVLPALAAGYTGWISRSRGRPPAHADRAPPRCWEPRELQQGARFWGVSAQIYSLRSAQNFGIGDYSDVARAADGAGALGASFLGLSPVHALFSADRTKISPYSPSSRLFLETLFIDPTAWMSFREARPRVCARAQTPRRASLPCAKARLSTTQPSGRSNGLCSTHCGPRFRQAGSRPSLTRSARAGGEPLEAHATFEALSEHFWNEGRWWLGDWPEPFRQVGAPEVGRFPRRV
jgi:(1->4)-alpha-D-glucan 1-alpha-D-glucosylmutase